MLLGSFYVMISTCVCLPYQVLLKSTEVQHRILEEMPLLAAFPGFKQIMGRRLNDEQVGHHYIIILR